MKIKQFDFPTYKDWSENMYYFSSNIGNYEVRIFGGDFSGDVVLYRAYLYVGDFYVSEDEISQLMLKAPITEYDKSQIEKWYNDACIKINAKFKKEIQEYLEDD